MTDLNKKYLKRSLLVIAIVNVVASILAALLAALLSDSFILSLVGWGILFFDIIMLLWTGFLLLFE